MNKFPFPYNVSPSINDSTVWTPDLRVTRTLGEQIFSSYDTNKENYQFLGKYNGDAYTIQYLAIPSIKQTTKIDKNRVSPDNLTQFGMSDFVRDEE